jgi:Holliday junction DNA helicase RuvA
MISYLNGTIQKKLVDSIIVNTNGVGYEAKINKNFYAECEENEDIEVYIHTAVREDDISLYGFQTLEELRMFKLLISVSGVGPKSALEILNNPIASLKYAIANGESALIVKTKGIGAKTADRILIDLKGKINATEKPDDYAIPQDVDNDALVALQGLGYKRHHIVRTLKNIPEEVQETEDIIRYFLQNA